MRKGLLSKVAVCLIVVTLTAVVLQAMPASEKITEDFSWVLPAVRADLQLAADGASAAGQGEVGPGIDPSGFALRCPLAG